MSDHLDKFQGLLREMFQFDSSDLDFGIYRIINYKHDVIDRFISMDLKSTINSEIDSSILAEQAQIGDELKEIEQQIKNTLGPEALNSKGKLDSGYHQTPLGKSYLNLKAKKVDAYSREETELKVLNYLFTFFNRYYQDGDFISKRRYSKNQKYSIPYNGEEVYFHWANNDQYYIKTDEYFNNYAFRSQGIAVHFQIQHRTEKEISIINSVRYFIPVLDNIIWHEDESKLIIPFEYRSLNQEENKVYGKRKTQDRIIEQALSNIPERIKEYGEALAAIMATRKADQDNQSTTCLEFHLRQYTKRNTSDFFIHKDLKRFLTRELDFFLKNEVMDLDELVTAGLDHAAVWLQTMRVINNIGHKIIDFLAQIEDFQKALWEKKKFISDVQYCITVGSIDERFYPEISACEPQWHEWRDLYCVDELLTDYDGVSHEERIKLINKYPTLVLDTKFFAQEFVDTLLSSFENIDAITDGLIVHSENFQALNLLRERFRNQVKCIYIDPPYNTQSSEILYKNTYKHSSWLSLIQDRLVLGKSFMRDDCVHVVAIDEVEQEHLGRLLSQHFPDYVKACIPIVHNPRGQQGKNISYVHDFAFFLYPSDREKYISDIMREEIDSRNLRDSGTESNREDAKNCFYPIFVKDDELIGVGEIPPDDFHPDATNILKEDGSLEIWPIDESGNEKKWRYAVNSVERIWSKLEPRQGRTAIQVIFNKDTGVMRSLWTGPDFDASEYGTKVLQSLLGKDATSMFSYPKSLKTVKLTLSAALGTSGSNIILDYFGGSGTTAHAAIELCREDGIRRPFIIVEIGGYFDSVLLPRIKKVTYAPEWNDCQPSRLVESEEFERSPRIIKYMHVESYEDVLNNIEFTDMSGQQTMGFEDYQLKYMLNWESRNSDTLLNVESLSRPFDYTLDIHSLGENQKIVVNIPETFNYLMGIHVETRQVYKDEDRKYLVFVGEIDDRRVAVIWRKTEGWTKSDFKRDKEFVISQEIIESMDEIFVNGTSFIPNSTSLEPTFKTRMFSPIEA